MKKFANSIKDQVEKYDLDSLRKLGDTDLPIETGGFPIDECGFSEPLVLRMARSDSGDSNTELDQSFERIDIQGSEKCGVNRESYTDNLFGKKSSILTIQIGPWLDEKTRESVISKIQKDLPISVSYREGALSIRIPNELSSLPVPSQSLWFPEPDIVSLYSITPDEFIKPKSQETITPEVNDEFEMIKNKTIVLTTKRGKEMKVHSGMFSLGKVDPKDPKILAERDFNKKILIYLFLGGMQKYIEKNINTTIPIRLE